MTRPYSPQQCIAIIRACHTVKDIDTATHKLYQYLPYMSLDDHHILSQVIFYRRKRLAKSNAK